ncbi:DUF2812 domain-containing protein [Oceanobacillus kapialis]|uniref:DUF2812 domain-containing protein n=1 Tax=Oceanobacillus kapialis TaxID=481353 RepID=A0ABW5Q1H7_9BACI
MRQRKYMMSGGLAFAEEKDMQKLRGHSLQGWHVSGFKFMGYVLERGESTDYVYNVDTRILNEGEKEEYLELFAAAGWSHVASEAGTHLFRAQPGTKPIYSDSETVAEKHKRSGKIMNGIALSLITITALLWIGVLLSSETVQTSLSVIAIISSVLSLPAVWTVLKIYSNMWRVEGRRKGLVFIITKVPPLLALMGIICLAFFKNDEGVVDIISSAGIGILIGGFGLPLVIYIIMSLSFWFSGKRV